MRIIHAVCTALITGTVSCGADPGPPSIEDFPGSCDEFQERATLSEQTNVDPNVGVFMQACADLSGEMQTIRVSVFNACARVALDLGANDSWSGIVDANAVISNADGTGACDAAAERVEALLATAQRTQANVAVVVSRGECHLDFDAQIACDNQCATDVDCPPGTVETRCDPASLSVLCSAACQAQATCVGRPERPCNCMGKCESECQGACRGECTHADGSTTQDDPKCRGKCSASCNGVCRGLCKIDEPKGVACGTDVRCAGACSAQYTAPRCVTEFGPPQCAMREDCHNSCSAKVFESAECDLPVVDVYANVQLSPDVEPLIATLKANLPMLITAAELHGKLVLYAANRLA
jgi:hypothetical protein